MLQVAEIHRYWGLKAANPYMSYSLNSLKGGHIGEYIGDYYRVTQGDTKSLNYSFYCIGAHYSLCSLLPSRHAVLR